MTTVNNMGVLTALACTVTLLCSAHVHAHGVWVAQRAGEWVLVLGEGAADDAYKPEAVKSVQALAADGSSLPVKLRPQARNVVLEPDVRAVAVALSFEDGYWSQDASGKWLAGSKSKVPGAQTGGYYQMYNTTLLAPGYKAKTAVSRTADFPLQIIPLSDPLALKKGATLEVQVLFKKRPLAGIKLASDYTNDPNDLSLPTNAQGRTKLKVRNAGLNVIKASHAVARPDRTEADEDGYGTTLAFSFPHKN